jgi:hypothetical protein
MVQGGRGPQAARPHVAWKAQGRAWGTAHGPRAPAGAREDEEVDSADEPLLGSEGSPSTASHWGGSDAGRGGEVVAGPPEGPRPQASQPPAGAAAEGSVPRGTRGGRDGGGGGGDSGDTTASQEEAAVAAAVASAAVAAAGGAAPLGGPGGADGGAGGPPAPKAPKLHGAWAVTDADSSALQEAARTLARSWPLDTWWVGGGGGTGPSQDMKVTHTKKDTNS